jgi:hypothetical protein
LDVVALLTDLPAQRLARGQVGTIVEQLDDTTLLVEFSDDQGRAYAVAPCPRADLLVLPAYRKQPDRRTAAQKRTVTRSVTCSGEIGAPA